MAMNQVDDQLWVGSMLALTGTTSFTENNITHVISAVDLDSLIDTESKQMLQRAKSRFTHLHIAVDDDYDGDILSRLQETNSFIEGAHKSGSAVLVHCLAGISRSATIACAYIMRRYKLTPEEALAKMREARPRVSPNYAFMEQLNVYYKCGYEVSPICQPYREWLLKKVSKSYSAPIGAPVYAPATLSDSRWIEITDSLAAGAEIRRVTVNGQLFAVTERIPKLDNDSYIELEVLSSDPGQPPRKQAVATQDVEAALAQRAAKRQTVIRCKACSAAVAGPSSLADHPIKLGKDGCQHFFVEPLAWMRTELEKGELDGKLLCPRCSAKLGTYQWQGSECSCKTWVVPSIKLAKARVDEMSVPKQPQVQRQSAL